MEGSKIPRGVRCPLWSLRASVLRRIPLFLLVRIVCVALPQTICRSWLHWHIFSGNKRAPHRNPLVPCLTPYPPNPCKAAFAPQTFGKCHVFVGRSPPCPAAIPVSGLPAGHVALFESLSRYVVLFR